MLQVWSQIRRGKWCFGVRRWWGKSKSYFLQKVLKIHDNSPLTKVKNIHLISIIQWSLRYKILSLFFFSWSVSRWDEGGGKEKILRFWKDLGKIQFIAFAILGRSLSLYKRYSLAPFLTTTDQGEEDCYKTQTLKQSLWYCGGCYGSKVGWWPRVTTLGDHSRFLGVLTY